MADEFNIYLASALAPDNRSPDREFVGQVHSRILLEQRLADERSALLRNFGRQIVALATVAAAALWIAQAAPIADSAARSPAVCLAILLTGFAFVVLLLTASGERQAVSPR